METLARVAESSGHADYVADRVRRFLAVLTAGGSTAPLSAALRLFDEGLFFDCHELLEPAWNAASGREKRVLQGVIQAGAGFHKLELGSSAGCAELLRHAAEKLADARGAGLRHWGGRLAEAAARAQICALGPADAPRAGQRDIDP